jgi:hypothetical protein
MPHNGRPNPEIVDLGSDDDNNIDGKHASNQPLPDLSPFPCLDLLIYGGRGWVVGALVIFSVVDLCWPLVLFGLSCC